MCFQYYFTAYNFCFFVKISIFSPCVPVWNSRSPASPSPGRMYPSCETPPPPPSQHNKRSETCASMDTRYIHKLQLTSESSSSIAARKISTSGFLAHTSCRPCFDAIVLTILIFSTPHVFKTANVAMIVPAASTTISIITTQLRLDEHYI